MHRTLLNIALGCALVVAAAIAPQQLVVHMDRAPLLELRYDQALAGLSNVSCSATSKMLIDANGSRRALYVFNDDTKTMYLKYGTTASSSSFTVKLAAGGYWEMPPPVYPGRIDVIWDAACTGSARVTEQ